MTRELMQVTNRWYDVRICDILRPDGQQHSVLTVAEDCTISVSAFRMEILFEARHWTQSIRHHSVLLAYSVFIHNDTPTKSFTSFGTYSFVHLALLFHHSHILELYRNMTLIAC